MLLDVLAEIAGRMLAGEGIGVVAIGQQQHPEVHAFGQQHVGTAKGGVDACRVAVIKQDDVRSEPVQDVDLVDGKGRSRVGHYVFYACLVHGDDVRIAFDHIDAVFLDDGTLSLINAIELTILVIDLGIGRVHVLLLNTLCGSIELAPAEAYNLATHAYPRKDDATGIAVDEFATVVLVADAHLRDELLLVALLQCRTPEGEGIGEVETQLELLDDVVANATLAEILHADGHSVGMVVQGVLEIFQGILVDDEHRLALRLLALLLVGELAFLYFNVVFVGQPSQCFRIGHLLVLHDKGDGRASLAATEAVAGVTGRRDHERRCLLVVERAQAFVVGTALAQRHKLAYHLYNVGGILDAFYCLMVDHL